MLKNLLDGLTSLGNVQALAYLFGGSIVGMFLGVVPGVGGLVILSVLLSFIYHISITGTICLFLAVHAASFFSASITSILLNTPAHPEAFAVTFDGFPMAQRGEAGRALGISATSTCIGGLIGCAALVGFIQIINILPTIFHPPEYVALVTIALLLVGTLGTDAVSKSVISAGIGLMISSIGSDPITGTFRYTFGAVGLYGGVSLVALALGLFAVPQMILIFGTATTIARQDMMGNEIGAVKAVGLQRGFGRQVIQGIFDSLQHWVVLISSAVIGVITGIIPGIGGFAANFLSYGVAQQLSKRREQFGTGIPEGIIAPEGSSLSKEAGGLVPIIGLGIPGGVGSALFLAALTIKGIKVGYGFAQQYPSLPYEMMWVIGLGGLIGTATGLLVAPFLSRVTRVPGPLLVPIIMSLAIVGPFVATVSFFTVMEVLVFACIGLCLRRLRYSLASFVMGLVLGPTLEINIHLTHVVFPGFTFLKRPLADVLFAIGIVVLILKSIQLRHDAQRAKVRMDDENTQIHGEDIRRRQESTHPYPLLGCIASITIAVVTIGMAAYAGFHYDFATALLPVIAGSLAGAGALWRMPFDISGYVTYRRVKSQRAEASAPSAIRPERPSKLATVGSAERRVIDSTFSIRTTDDDIGVIDPAASTRMAPWSPSPVQEKSWGLHGQYTRELVALLWFVGCISLCYTFGFKVGIPTFVALYGLTATRRVFPTWHGRIGFAAISATVMWGTTFEMINLLHLQFTPIIHF